MQVFKDACSLESLKENNMNFAFSDEQEQLREFVRSFLEEKSDEAAVREQMETEQGFDSDVWQQMCDQLALPALIIPEEFGGQGYGYVELIVVLEEMVSFPKKSYVSARNQNFDPGSCQGWGGSRPGPHRSSFQDLVI